MKKIASVVLLAMLCFVGGCSCNKDIYKFDSIEIDDGTGTKTYTCSSKDREDASVKAMCEGFDGISIELKDEDTLVVNFPASNMKDEEIQYKIENGYLYLEDDGDWRQFAEYTNKSIILAADGYKVILKK